jgi:hypothetical protein
MLHRLEICLALTLFAASGCAHLTAMTPEVVKADGRRVFPGDKDKVFQAVTEALDALDIGVALAKPESGLIISKRFLLAAYASGNYVVTGNEDTMQYDITVRPLAEGEVEVLASPRGYHNNQEVTDRNVWQLDGAQGQRQRWQKLFAQIQRMLGA